MLKMKDSLACDIYVSDDGYLTFKQDQTWPNNDEPSYVVLSYEQALALRDFLPELIQMQEKSWNGGLKANDAGDVEVG